ncbi:MAG: PTS sugar transporter subunit IIB [Anaerolineaceae bacterium]
MRVLTVCGMGFGTSLMLLMDIQAIGKRHGINIEGEALDISSVKGKKADLIIASSEIAKTLDISQIPIIAIKNILDKREIETKLMEFIDHHQNNKPTP